MLLIKNKNLLHCKSSTMDIPDIYDLETVFSEADYSPRELGMAAYALAFSALLIYLSGQ